MCKKGLSSFQANIQKKERTKGKKKKVEKKKRKEERSAHFLFQLPDALDAWNCCKKFEK